jgi:hypothetical protein
MVVPVSINGDPTGLSPQPWEERKPGYSTHRIEYRAIDAEGNIGPAQAFLVTVRQSK